jgi:hypothetical protein
MGCPGIGAPGDRRLLQAKNHETLEALYKRAPRVGVLRVGVKATAAS